MTPLKRLLFERELKIKWLAQQCGISETNLNLIVNGKRIPSLVVALRIADALGVNVETLWGYVIKGGKDGNGGGT